MSPFISLNEFFPRNFANHRAPYAEIDGARVVIHNFRNFDYTSKTDFRPEWETKTETVHLSDLRTVDFLPTTGDQRLLATPS
jgi:hypothetical protein